MKYNNTNDPFLKKLNDASADANDYGIDPTYRIIPEGNNTMPTKALYYQRLNYEIEFDRYCSLNAIKSQNFKDYKYTHFLYGKINLKNEVVNINEEKYLKNLNANPSISLLSPAADAFNDLFIRHKILVEKKAISKNNKYSNIFPKKGFISPNIQHSNYVNLYFNKFYTLMNENNLNKNIVDFKSFIKYFIHFYNQNTNKVINKTEFMQTSMCDLLSTGLVIEVSTDKHGDDKNSYLNYVRQDSFRVFDNLSKQYGFVIDKHSPWRLTFDIAGSSAQKYLQNYNVTNLNNYFEQFYYYTEYFNYQTLKNNLINLYNFLINDKQTVTNVQAVFKDNKLCINNKLITREFIKEKDFNKHFSEDEMIKIYFYTKAKENNIIVSEQIFEQQFEEVIKIKNFNGLIMCFDHIQKLCMNKKDTGDDKLNLIPIKS